MCNGTRDGFRKIPFLSLVGLDPQTDRLARQRLKTCRSSGAHTNSEKKYNSKIKLVLFVLLHFDAINTCLIHFRFSPWEQLSVHGGMFDITSPGLTFPNSLLFSFGTLMWQGTACCSGC